ncbi:hypothetical protein C8J57DRAFT_1508228 [Mycena rebaudengoi]|nr:hypothetical protein C8J57DRAFT_1508228 [Mycena rebaudengoi]
MMFKLSTLVLAASLLGVAVASPTNSELESRATCQGNNSACGGPFPRAAVAYFATPSMAAVDRAWPATAPASLASRAAPGSPAAPCLVDAAKRSRFNVVRLPSAPQGRHTGEQTQQLDYGLFRVPFISPTTPFIIRPPPC